MPLGIRCYRSDTSPKMAKHSLSARRPVKIIFYQSGSEKFLYIGDKSLKKNNGQDSRNFMYCVNQGVCDYRFNVILL